MGVYAEVRRVIVRDPLKTGVACYIIFSDTRPEAAITKRRNDQMKEVLLRELFRNTKEYDGQEILVRGWVRNNRSSNKFGFIELNDGTFFKSVQIVYEEEFIDNFEEISKAYVATALAVTGVVTLTPQAKQPFEIKARKVEVEAASTPDYPLQPKRHTMEFLREIAHLRPRSNTFSAVFRVRSLVAYAIHRFFQERDFVYVHTSDNYRQRPLRGRERCSASPPLT